jgi:uncharacterized protein
MHTETVSLELPTGERFAGTYAPGSAARSFAVLWVHGFGSHRGGEKALAVREECARRGWAFAAFDFRGHGESGGTMLDLRASRLLEDLSAARDWLAVRGHSRLGLVGSSMGGFASAWFAKRNPDAVVGSVLLAPAFGFLDRRWDKLTSDEQAEWRRTGKRLIESEWVSVEVGIGLVEERAAFAPKELVRDWRVPSLLFHGMSDTVVPDTDSLYFARHAEFPRIELRLLKDGDHRLTAYKDAIAGAAGSFFADLLEG